MIALATSRRKTSAQINRAHHNKKNARQFNCMTQRCGVTASCNAPQ
jgi:hypothetical protein